MHILRRTWAEVDLTAAEKNFNIIKDKAKGSKVCCVVKADGYGHGAKVLSKLYESLGADYLAVSNIDEAEELRDYGIKLPILILGYTPVDDAKRLIKLKLTQAVYSLDFARALSEKCRELEGTIKVHIKIDTGMSRIGFMCQSFPRDEGSVDEIAEVCGLYGLEAEGIMAHFSVADEGEEGREYTEKQLENFDYTINALKDRNIEFDIIHHANSAGTEDYENAHKTMVRAGIILYGLAPSGKLAGALPLSPIMTLKTSVASVKKIYKGTTISYGRTFEAKEDMTVATVTIGYADGYFRDFSNKGYMLIKGKKCRILGRVCMDQTIVDVSDVGDVRIGDEAIVFSATESPTVDDLASFADTINYEVVCAVSKRVPRYYQKNSVTVDVMYKL
ncbi:MAG: alanine racemase [Ruminococcaceae bacterium]|nr:alanine racemase [Oscillospiraceae bacterium]